jgi:hypothetical protein
LHTRREKFLGTDRLPGRLREVTDPDGAVLRKGPQPLDAAFEEQGSPGSAEPAGRVDRKRNGERTGDAGGRDQPSRARPRECEQRPKRQQTRQGYRPQVGEIPDGDTDDESEREA